MTHNQATGSVGQRHPGRRRFMVAVSATVIAVAALSGCGFHLQGASPLPRGVSAMNVTYHNNYRVGDPPLVTDLRQRLREQGLLGDSDAPAQLNIRSIQDPVRVVSVSPLDAGASELSLTTRVVFDYAVNGVSQIKGQTLSETRDYTVNDTQRLASESQRRDLLRAMHQDLANLILLRIAEANHRLVKLHGHAS